MASMTAGQSGKLQSDNLDTNYTFALRALTTLFFMWGFITCLNDILIPHLKGIFDLSYSQAMLVQFCFFGAYFLVSVPAGFLVKRIGYQKGIVIGLVIAALGCAMFYPAASLMSYPVFLLALFVLASGITVLQVSANPYVSNLGPAKTASARLNLTQAFNALGTTVAPFFGALLILDHTATVLSAAESADSVKLPYLLLASALLILAAVFAWLKLPDLKIDHAPDIVVVNPDASIWQYRHLVLGVIAIFVYVGAEVAIGSFLVSFLSLPDIAGLTEQTAAHYIAYYWGGAMVGRFIGAGLLHKIDAGKLLCFNAVMAMILICIAIVSTGSIAMWAILFVGLCNSIMFPTIFSLAINQLKELTSQGSGLLCLAIVGGAIIPLLQGMLADEIGVQLAFILPVFCYGFIAYYGFFGARVMTPLAAAQQE